MSPDGRYLAAASRTGTVLLDTQSGRQVRLNEADASVLIIGGGLLAGSRKDGRISLWDLASGHEVRRLEMNGPAEAIAFSPDHRLLAAGGPKNTLQVWHV